jgi:hypothetical protein
MELLDNLREIAENFQCGYVCKEITTILKRIEYCRSVCGMLCHYKVVIGSDDHSKSSNRVETSSNILNDDELRYSNDPSKLL